MFPIYIKDQEPFPAPRDATYFLLARDGVYLVKRSPVFEAVTRYDGVLPGLASQTPQLQLNLPPLPQDVVETVVGFFLQVFRRYGTEAIVVLFYSTDSGFHVEAPPQQVSHWGAGCDHLVGYHVQYGRCQRPPNYVQLGTIHSHGALPATHSHVDKLDERHQEGLHITVGDVTAPQPSFSAAFVANGHRFQLSPEQILAGYARPRLPAPAKWLAQVSCRPYQTYGWSFSHG